MNAHGSLSIARNPVRWSEWLTIGHAVTAAVGILAGAAAVSSRMPLHWPGHKALFWMVPVLASGIATRTRGGVSLGALAAALTAACLGGRLAGGPASIPMVLLAGVVIDRSLQMIRRHGLSLPLQMPVLAIAASLGNLICFSCKLFDPAEAFISRGNLSELFRFAASHALFGLLAGLLGSLAGYALLAAPQAKTLRS